MSELSVGRRPRSDRGRSRLSRAVERKLQALLAADELERPSVTRVWKQLGEHCKRHGLAVPARGTVYNAIERVEAPAYPRAELPDSIVRTLHNVADDRVTGHQVVFSAFNYGDARALSYASALPWSCLLRASKMRGWRPKSAALLRAVMQFRGI